MSALDDLLKKHRQQIINREKNTFRELLTAYEEIGKELKNQFDDLQEKTVEAQENEETFSKSWIFKEKRLESLLAQVKNQIVRFGGTAARIIEREQSAAIQIAVRHTQETFDLLISVADFPKRNFAATLNPRTVETAVGLMGDGSPIISYFEKQLAPAVAQKIKSEVIKAAALGTDFRTISKNLQETGGITKHRALSTARTEVNRVRRETTRMIYQDNSDIVEAWEWVSAKSLRTVCIVCLLLDGIVFSLNEKVANHPNCRCSPLPVIKGIKRNRETGLFYFERQTDEIKRKILGESVFEKYQNKTISLKELLGVKNDPIYGKVFYKKSLGEILKTSSLTI